MDCLGIGAVLGQGYVIKKRLRWLSESSYFLSPLYLLLNGTRFFFTSVSGFIYRFVTNAGRLVTHNCRRTLKLTAYLLDIEFIEGRLVAIRTG